MVWTVADPLEIHTVTFVSGGEPRPFVEPRPGPAGPEGPPLLVIPADIVNPTGGTAYTGQGFIAKPQGEWIDRDAAERPAPGSEVIDGGAGAVQAEQIVEIVAQAVGGARRTVVRRW